MEKKRMYMIMASHYEQREDFVKAREFYEKALEVEESANIHERIGLVFLKNKQTSEAKEHFLKGIVFEPENKCCIYNLAIIERMEGDYESSMARYSELKRIGHEDAGLDMNMGVVHSETGNVGKALGCYEAALKKNDTNKLLLFNYSMCLMTLGDYARGLELYENRIWDAKPPGEKWKGEKDAAVMVSPEQGNGDTIQFARYLRTLRSRCRKITLLCNAPLVELMGRVEGVDEVVEFNPGDEFVQVEKERKEEGLSAAVPYGKFLRMLSLPYALGLNPTLVPFERYIKTDKNKTKRFGTFMKSDKIKVGLCWQGGVRDDPEMKAIDKRRSIRLADMSPIVSIDGVEFYSLQKDDKQHHDAPSIKDVMEKSKNFDDTASIIENLDMVISVDTAVAHLAASLEKPTWMLSRKGGCWRWGSEGESTFWYPSMRIFRQETMNSWGPTILKVASELKKFVQASR